MKHHRNKLLLAGALLFTPFLCMAQAAYCPPEAPITGGLGILAAAGIGYGIRKYKSATKNV